LLAKEMGDKLRPKVGPELVARGRHFLKEPGISVLRDAEIVQQAGRPHAMHDPTEGGLATGLWEMAHASRKGIVVDLSKVQVFPETERFCQALSMDPLGVIASGALLVSASQEESLPMVEALRSVGIHAAVIGRVVEGPAAVEVRTADGLLPLPSFTRDEIARAFEEQA
jgi:hydrogenase maturation factor